jgi:micrococcal nuclease
MDESKLYYYRAKVVNVVDGDTIDAEISVGFHASLTARLRLLGVNCPEVHGATKEAGLAAAAFTRAALLGKDVLIRTEKSDVFGRWLASVFVDGVAFNASLLAQGHAVPFRPS